MLVIVDAHDRLETSGVSLRSATEPIDTSNPSGRLIFQMLASFAEYERGTIRERTQAGLHRALRNGKFSGRLPYGYRLSPDERGLEIVEGEAAVVRQIIANIAEGSTLYSESKRLNDEGIPSPATASGATSGGGTRGHGLPPPSGASSTRRRIPASTESASRAETVGRRSSSARSPPSSSRLLRSGRRRSLPRTRAAPGNFARTGGSTSSRDSFGAASADSRVRDAPPPAGVKSTATTAVSPTAARGAL